MFAYILSLSSGGADVNNGSAANNEEIARRAILPRSRVRLSPDEARMNHT